jgi:hypothetical protein
VGAGGYTPSLEVTNVGAGGYTPSLEVTNAGAVEYTHSLEMSPPPSSSDDVDDKGDNFSLSELDQFLPGPPPNKQPKYTGSGSPPTTTWQQMYSVSSTSSISEAEAYPTSPTASCQEGFVVSSSRDGSRVVNIADTVKIKVPHDAFIGVTLDRDKLIDMPIDNFNLLLQKSSLGGSGVAYMKEWRRKGKNKKAAKIARKRKRDEMGDLEFEVDDLKEQISSSTKKKEEILRELRELKTKSAILENQLLSRYSLEHGANVSRRTHHLFISSKPDSLFLVPRLAAATK